MIVDSRPPGIDPYTMATPSSQLLNGRYRLGPQIGAGAQAVTHRACDVETGTEVAVKILRLSDVSDWKGLELFERETSTLRALEHPGIPGYLDDFVIDGEGGARTYHLVQEFVDGRSLEGLAPLDEDRFRRLLDDLLEILAYLSSHSPPVVHRDVKPANILIGRDGRARLVDFGCVQVITPRETGGSTVVGTTGYMAPEQLMGMSDPRSDLYGLGATCIYALTGESPAELEQERMKIIWRERAAPRLDAAAMDMIDRLVEPHAEDRFASVGDARLALAGSLPARAEPAAPRHPTPTRARILDYKRLPEPPQVRADIVRSTRRVDFRIPGYILRGQFVAASSAAFCSVVMMVAAVIYQSALGAAFMFGLIILTVIASVEGLRARNEEGLLRIEGDTFSAQFKSLYGAPMNMTADLAQLRGFRPGDEDPENLYVDTSSGLMMFARDLDEREQAWLGGELSHLLREEIR